MFVTYLNFTVQGLTETLDTPITAKSCAGFSYVEVLIATMLIAVCLVPALEALHTGLLGSGIHRDSVEEHYHLQAKLEEMLAQPIDFNQFLNEYFFSTTFLVAVERFNRMTPQEKSQLGKLDHAYFGAILPTPATTSIEDPTLGKVINAVEPTGAEMPLECCPEDPYLK